MSAFEFDLADVLELRSDREREMAAELAAAMQRVDDLREEKERLESRREAARERMARLSGSGGVSASSTGTIHSLTVVLRRLENRIAESTRELESARAEVEELTEQFQEVLRDRQIIERLRQRRLEEWREEKTRSERKRMDEVAINRHSTERPMDEKPEERR